MNGEKTMKKLNEKSWMNNRHGHILVLHNKTHQDTSRLLIFFKSISGQQVVSRYQEIQYLGE
jgi:hypothetical protein